LLSFTTSIVNDAGASTILTDNVTTGATGIKQFRPVTAAAAAAAALFICNNREGHDRNG
jgi:hypothetical protein